VLVLDLEPRRAGGVLSPSRRAVVSEGPTVLPGPTLPLPNLYLNFVQNLYLSFFISGNPSELRVHLEPILGLDTGQKKIAAVTDCAGHLFWTH
jgi:hypothetical protein